jgi:hypothetical protein
MTDDTNTEGIPDNGRTFDERFSLNGFKPCGGSPQKKQESIL